MGFSEKMRESLGADGARMEVRSPEEPVSPGGTVPATIVIRGGNVAAEVASIMLRVIEARRSWSAENGATVTEEEAMAMTSRSQLMPAWSRRTVHEQQVELGSTVEAGDEREIAVEITIPDSCGTTSPECVITLNAQADIPGQIDPTANGRLQIR